MLDIVVCIEVGSIDVVYDVVGLPDSLIEQLGLGLFGSQLVQLLSFLL